MLECSPLYCRARSSTAEQRPFKPTVEGSNPSALTKNPCFQGFFHGKMNEPNLKYTKSMPITLARIGQSGQCGWANTLFLDGMDEEIKNGWDEAAVQKPLVI
jgi:hypothetical protein